MNEKLNIVFYNDGTFRVADSLLARDLQNDPNWLSTIRLDILVSAIQDYDKDKKVGMYGETPQIIIGRLTISEMNIPAGESVWIEHESGEGGEFRKDLLEPVLQKFYDENF